jgi:hypothetical protein
MGNKGLTVFWINVRVILEKYMFSLFGGGAVLFHDNK